MLFNKAHTHVLEVPYPTHSQVAAVMSRVRALLFLMAPELRRLCCCSLRLLAAAAGWCPGGEGGEVERSVVGDPGGRLMRWEVWRREYEGGPEVGMAAAACSITDIGIELVSNIAETLQERCKSTGLATAYHAWLEQLWHQRVFINWEGTRHKTHLRCTRWPHKQGTHVAKGTDTTAVTVTVLVGMRWPPTSGLGLIMKQWILSSIGAPLFHNSFLHRRSHLVIRMWSWLIAVICCNFRRGK